MEPIRFRSLALAMCMGLCGGLPMSVVAQSAGTTAASVIQDLQVNADAGFQPGSTIEFTLRAPPRGQARVQVAGTPIDVNLRESSPGVYRGSYTVRRTDRLDASALIRASVLAGGRTATSEFRFPASFAAQQQAAAPPAQSLPSTRTVEAVRPPPPPAPQVRIDRFEADPVRELTPGTVLRFTVQGVPGATATVQWPGLDGALLLREQQPGRYVGQYTLRSQDPAPGQPVVATLSSGGRRATAQLRTPLVAAAPAAPAATTPPPSAAAPAPAAPGAPTGMGAAPNTLWLQLTQPLPNAQVDVGQLVLQGRTAPGAMVHVRVDAVPPAPPGRLGVAQPVLQQTVQADANGTFRVGVGAYRALPGTRFDIQVSATQGAQATPEQRLTVFQRAG